MLWSIPARREGSILVSNNCLSVGTAAQTHGWQNEECINIFSHPSSNQITKNGWKFPINLNGRQNVMNRVTRGMAGSVSGKEEMVGKEGRTDFPHHSSLTTRPLCFLLMYGKAGGSTILQGSLIVKLFRNFWNIQKALCISWLREKWLNPIRTVSIITYFYLSLTQPLETSSTPQRPGCRFLQHSHGWKCHIYHKHLNNILLDQLTPRTTVNGGFNKTTSSIL